MWKLDPGFPRRSSSDESCGAISWASLRLGGARSLLPSAFLLPRRAPGAFPSVKSQRGHRNRPLGAECRRLGEEGEEEKGLPGSSCACTPRAGNGRVTNSPLPRFNPTGAGKGSWQGAHSGFEALRPLRSTFHFGTWPRLHKQEEIFVHGLLVQWNNTPKEAARQNCTINGFAMIFVRTTLTAGSGSVL